jgi:hypothetical protein
MGGAARRPPATGSRVDPVFLAQSLSVINSLRMCDSSLQEEQCILVLDLLVVGGLPDAFISKLQHLIRVPYSVCMH